MAATFTPEYDVTEVETSGGRRRKITKFALAGVAVLGVGAALTSAAWSDDVFFRGTTETGTLDLEGSITGNELDPAEWSEGDGRASGIAIELPADALDNVGPNITDTYTVYVRNKGTLDVHLGNVDVEELGPIFNGVAPDKAVADADDWSASELVLSPQEVATLQISVTGGDWEGNEYQGRTGTVIVHVQGTSAP